MLNFFGYSEEELVSGIEADDEKEVADEIAELLEEGAIAHLTGLRLPQRKKCMFL